jgi:phosphotransferase system  glucose/maltose/N-acetylglucosamine-specific IIC component
MVLERTEVDINISQLLGNIVRIVAAGGVMVLAVLVATSAIAGDAGIAALSRVVVGVVVGGAAYLVALRVFGESTLRDYLSSNTTRSSR